VAAKLHVISTTEPLRLGYDGSNYATFTVTSDGSLTISNNVNVADLSLNPPNSLNLGTAQTDDIHIGRTDMNQGGLTTTLNGHVVVSGSQPTAAGSSAGTTLQVTGAKGLNSSSSGTPGGVGGLVQLVAGAGGDMTATSGGTAGAGATLTATAGAGGTASGSSTGGVGGDVNISAGAGGGSSSGTKGNGGAVTIIGGAEGGTGASRGEVNIQTTNGGQVTIGNAATTDKLLVNYRYELKGDATTKGILQSPGLQYGAASFDSRGTNREATLEIYSDSPLPSITFHEHAVGHETITYKGSNGSFGISNASPGSKLSVAGPIATATTEQSTNDYALTNSYSVVFVNASGGAKTIRLPAASNDTVGRVYYLYKIDSSGNAVTVAAPNGSSDAVNGTTSTSTRWQCLRVVGYTNVSWIVSRF
jgi:hypothetical protein